ncbi:MAG TPA: CGNR zinc finger domain-containing protein [Thermoanaerobaculia bacterium]|nr:CGNR zinc finger domain-containing protein [Thermoanaerobaculia bacterium]
MPAGNRFAEDSPLCLAFANTAGFHALADRHETLGSFDALIQWAVEAGTLPRRDGRRLLQQGDDHARELLGRAVALRDALQSLFSRIARKRPPSLPALETVNRELGNAMRHATIVAAGGAYRWSWERSESAERLLWPVVGNAADLLASPLLERLRECSGRDCSRLFIDRSRNGSRRWCSMEGCGNRAKVRRHYRRMKQIGS